MPQGISHGFTAVTQSCTLLIRLQHADVCSPRAFHAGRIARKGENFYFFASAPKCFAAALILLNACTTYVLSRCGMRSCLCL